MDLVYLTKFPGIRWSQIIANNSDAKPKLVQGGESKETRSDLRCSGSLKKKKKKKKKTRQTWKKINPEMLMLCGLFCYFLFQFFLVYHRVRFWTSQKTIDL